MNKIKTGYLNSLSAQQLIDCCDRDGLGCEGCEGSLPEQALEYAKSNGLVTEEIYPQTDQQNSLCKVNQGPYKIQSYQFLPYRNSTSLLHAVINQPISVSVDASSWQFYAGGLFMDCTESELNHAVLLVGYTKEYWIVKNSWGTGWGQGGYIWLPRRGNPCMIADRAIATFLPL